MQPQQQSNGSNSMVQGRIVWTVGDLFSGRVKTNSTTKQPVLGQDGQPQQEYGFGLAIPKINPATGQFTEEYVKIWNLLRNEASTLFNGGQVPQNFPMKFKDGDTEFDDKGQPFSKREGYAGHIVLACTTQIPPKFYLWQGGNNVLVSTGFKSGDYVNVQLNVKAHPAVGTFKPGLYVNPTAVQMIQPGKEIINAPSGDQLFGMNAPQYSGQMEAPQQTMPGQNQMMNNGSMGPGMNQQMQPNQGQQMMNHPQQNNQMQQPQQMMPNQGMQQQAVDPHYGVLPQGHQPQQGQQMMPNQGMQQNFQQPQQNQMMGNGQMMPNQGQQYSNTPAMPSQGDQSFNGQPQYNQQMQQPQQGQQMMNNGMPAMPQR